MRIREIEDWARTVESRMMDNEKNLPWGYILQSRDGPRAGPDGYMGVSCMHHGQCSE
jgi:hypothetical protein